MVECLCLRFETQTVKKEEEKETGQYVKSRVARITLKAAEERDWNCVLTQCFPTNRQTYIHTDRHIYT